MLGFALTFVVDKVGPVVLAFSVEVYMAGLALTLVLDEACWLGRTQATSREK